MHEDAHGLYMLHIAQAAGEGYQAEGISSKDNVVFTMGLAFHEATGAPLFPKYSTVLEHAQGSLTLGK